MLIDEYIRKKMTEKKISIEEMAKRLKVSKYRVIKIREDWLISVRFGRIKEVKKALELNEEEIKEFDSIYDFTSDTETEGEFGLEEPDISNYIKVALEFREITINKFAKRLEITEEEAKKLTKDIEAVLQFGDYELIEDALELDEFEKREFEEIYKYCRGDIPGDEPQEQGPDYGYGNNHEGL